VGAEKGFGPDYALTTLTFDSGAVAHVESTWMDPSGFRVTFEVCGSDGMIEYDSRTAAALRTHTAGGTRLESPLAAEDDPYLKQLKDFVRACQNDGPGAVSGYDGFMALSISVAALRSARTGEVVAPVREL
jgi:predicted dehydrogenase